MIKDMIEELAGIEKEVKCPLKALSVDRRVAYCNAEIKIGGETITKSCLGSIRSDVISTCSGCKLAMISKAKKKIIMVPVIEGCAKCPAMNTEVDIENQCLKCPYFNKEKFEKAGEESPEGKIEFIPCGYPNFPSEKVKLEGFIKAKKAAGVI